MSVDGNNEIPVADYQQVDDKLRGWIAERLLSGDSPDNLAIAMRGKKIREHEIVAEIRQAIDNPYMKAMKSLANRHKRNEWLLNKYSKLNAMSKNRHVIDRCSRLQPDEFFEKYYFRNKPVIITGMVDDWPAFALWGLEYFKKNFGDEQVEMQFHRDYSQKHYGPGPSRYSKLVPLSEYIDLIADHSPTNEYYLSRWNNKKCRHLMKKLADDLRQWPFTDSMEGGSVWIGPAGTVTPLHYDAVNILMVQVVGRKKIHLAPSYDAVHLRGESSFHYSDIDVAAIDYDAFPQAKNASFIEIVLHPKEVLFLPAGWWHAVTAMDISTTLTFENFIHEN
jgi:hypothetical protein